MASASLAFALLGGRHQGPSLGLDGLGRAAQICVDPAEHVQGKGIASA